MTGGPERRDESVSFSLKELMKLEDERIDQEKQASAARERAAKAARDEAERRERAALAAQAAAEAAEREDARRREREEEARLEAIQRAAVEQTRITVEARTRAEEAERERSHERELSRMRLEAQRRPGLGALVGSGLAGVALALAAFLVFFFGAAKPAADRRIAELDGTAAAAQARATSLERRVDEQSSQLALLGKQLEATRAQLAAAEAAKPPAPAPTTRGGAGPTAPPVRKPVKEAPCIDPRDPMCFDIPRP
jgi:colicin import membrane protein